MNYSDGHRHIGGDSSHLPRPSRRLCLSCFETWASDASVEALCLPFASYRPFASCRLTVRLVFPGDHPPAANGPPGPERRLILPAPASWLSWEAWSHGPPDSGSAVSLRRWGQRTTGPRANGPPGPGPTDHRAHLWRTRPMFCLLLSLVVNL